MTAATDAAASTTPRLQRGTIPPSWTQPAESVSVPPAPVRRPLAPLLVVGAGVALCVVLAIWLAPRPAEERGARAHAAVVTPVERAPVVETPAAVAEPTPVLPQAIEDVAEPPATASSTPTGMAPEDQGGAERPLPVELTPVETPPVKTPPVKTPTVEPPGRPAAAGAAEVVAAESVAVAPPAPVDADAATLTELPARRKAKSLVARAEKLLLASDASGAAPLLKRAAALDPSFPDAWRNLGIARATLGDTSGARIAYRRYITLAPDAPDAAEVKQILAR